MLGARGIYYGGYPWRDLGILTAADLNSAVAVALQEPSSFPGDTILNSIPDGSLSNSKLMNPYVVIGSTNIPLGPSNITTLSGLSNPVNPQDAATKYYVDNAIGLEGYTAGVGLTLIGNQFNIANQPSLTAGSYGTSSQVPQIAINQQGQITHAGNVPISMSAAQLSNGITGSGQVVLNTSPTLAGQVLVTGNQTVQGTLSIGGGAVGINSTGITVNNIAAVNIGVTGSLNVTGTSSIGNNGQYQSNYNVSMGATYISGVLLVNENMYTNSALQVYGPSYFTTGSFSGDVNINGANISISSLGIKYLSVGSGNQVAVPWRDGSLQAWVDGGSIGYIQVNASDRGIKDNIAPARRDALAAICAAPLYEFDQKLPVADAPVRHHDIGFIAQEMEDITAAVHPPSGEGGLHGLDLLPLTAYAWRAIQQIAERLDALEGGR